VSDQLERLNAEAASRTKRERRRANEIKARTIQRMQLQMTTPLDIGLEQQDAALVLGQDDVFDLAQAENKLRDRINDDDDPFGGSDDDELGEAGSESDVVLDSDREREKKVIGLEAELDGLYDAYQDRLRERDAKYKAMEARRKNTEREEWYGIQEEQNDGSDSSVGGWDEKNGSDLSDDSESDDESESSLVRGKRQHDDSDICYRSKRPRLVTKLEDPKIPASKAAQVWFSQDIFAEIDGPDEDEGLEDDSNDDDMSVEEHSQSQLGAAVRTTICLILLFIDYAAGQLTR
jgi:AdoMet-dependent rRNA methyltransferase SPB1